MRLRSYSRQTPRLPTLWDFGEGRVEIKGAQEYTHQTLFKNNRLSIDEISTRFPVPEISIVRCRWTLDGHVTPKGSPLPTHVGLLVNTLRRECEKWLIIDSQNTDIVEGVNSRPQ